MKEYVDLMLKIRFYMNDDVITMSGEEDWDDPNADDDGWT